MTSVENGKNVARVDCSDSRELVERAIARLSEYPIHKPIMDLLMLIDLAQKHGFGSLAGEFRVGLNRDDKIGNGSIAKSIAEALYGMGRIESPEVLEVVLTDHFEDKTLEQINAAKGRLLFINQAGSLTNAPRVVGAIIKAIDSDPSLHLAIGDKRAALDELFKQHPALERRLRVS